MKTIENNLQVTVVNESSSACAAHNESNKSVIDMGLEFPWVPNEQILRQEKAQAERAAAGFKLENDAKGILLSLGAVMVGTSTRRGTVGNVEVEIDDVRASTRSYYSSSVSGWRLYIGGRYGSDKGGWVGIGDGATLGINAKQQAKALEKIKEIQTKIDARQAKRKEVLTVAARTNSFISANGDFCKMVGHSSFNDGVTVYGHDRRAYYQTAFLVNEDGSVKIGGETFTVAQWTEIYNLRAAQAEAMKSLKDSFKTISPAS